MFWCACVIYDTFTCDYSLQLTLGFLTVYSKAKRSCLEIVLCSLLVASSGLICNHCNGTTNFLCFREEYVVWT